MVRILEVTPRQLCFFFFGTHLTSSVNRVLSNNKSYFEFRFLLVCPKGDCWAKGKSLSFFISLKDDTSLEPGQNLYVEYELRIEDKVHNNHHTKKGEFFGFSF